MQLEKSNTEHRLPSVHEAVKALTRPWFHQGFEWTTSHGEQNDTVITSKQLVITRSYSSSDAKMVPPVNNWGFKLGRISVTY